MTNNMTWRESQTFFLGVTEDEFARMPDEEKMERRWKRPQHVPTEQYGLWALERVFSGLYEQCEQSPQSGDLREARRILMEIILPLREQIEEQGLDGWDEFMNRHSGDAFAVPEENQ